MKLKLVLFLVACVLFISETTPAAVINAAYTGPGATLNYKPDGMVYVQPGSLALQVSQSAMVPIQMHGNSQGQPVLVQVSGQGSAQPVNPIAVIPASSATPTYSFGSKVYSIFDGISNAIVSKTRTVGDFIRALCGGRPQYSYVRPQYVLVNVPTEQPTTKTTKCHKTTKKHEHTTEHTTTESTTEQSSEECDHCDD